jgi:predicted dehydrogenase
MTRSEHHVLVIGVGSIGERHLRCFLETGRARASFVEANAERRDDVARRYTRATAFEDLDAAIESGVSAAVVATPAPLHVPLAIRLAEQGVHLLIEKPLGVSMDSVDALQQTVERRGVVAGVAYVYRCHPALAEMRAAIAEGRFGRPLELVVVAGQNFPFYRPAYRQTYYASRAMGGGAVQDALTHLINAGEWLVGPINRVVADAAHLAVEGVDVEDTVHVLARHDGERVLGSYSLNQHQAPNETAITVVCERGTSRFEYHLGRWRFMTRAGEEWIDPAPLPPPLARDALFVRQAGAFLDAIEGGPAPPCPLRDGVSTLRVNLAVLRSVAEQRWQEVNL